MKPFLKHYPESEYCTFLYADGRRCRMHKMPTREVCLHHWRQDGHFTEDEVAVVQFVRQTRTLHTPAGLNRALAALFRLTALGKIPHRKAALLSYQIHLLMCTMPRAGKNVAALPDLPEVDSDPIAQIAANLVVEEATETGPYGANGSATTASGETEPAHPAPQL
jgi:hypothetical protein